MHTYFGNVSSLELVLFLDAIRWRVDVVVVAALLTNSCLTTPDVAPPAAPDVESNTVWSTRPVQLAIDDSGKLSCNTVAAGDVDSPPVLPVRKAESHLINPSIYRNMSIYNLKILFIIYSGYPFYS